MPNGWYPVPGLDVVMIHRTEQRYPRLDWDASGNELYVIESFAPRGFTPRRALPADVGSSFDGYVEQARRLVAGEPELHAQASALWLDFAARRGAACGRFSVYAFARGEVSVLHDQSFPHRIGDTSIPVHTTTIDSTGLKCSGEAEPTWHFSFADADALVASNAQLHHDPHWPPKTSLDGVAIALASERVRDIVLALWRR